MFVKKMSTAHLVMNPQSRLIASGDAVPPSYSTSWLAVTEPTDREPVIEPIKSQRTVFDLKEVDLTFPRGSITQDPGPGANEGTPWLQSDETVVLGFDPTIPPPGFPNKTISASAEFMANSYQVPVGDQIFQMGRVNGVAGVAPIRAVLYEPYEGFGPLKVQISSLSENLWWRGLVVTIVTGTAGPNNGFRFLTKQIVENGDPEPADAPTQAKGPEWTRYNITLLNIDDNQNPYGIFGKFNPIFYSTSAAFQPSVFNPATGTSVYGRPIDYFELRGGTDYTPAYTRQAGKAYGISDNAEPAQPIAEYGAQTVVTPEGRVYFLPMAADTMAWYDTTRGDGAELEKGSDNWWSKVLANPVLSPLLSPQVVKGATVALYPWDSQAGTTQRPLVMDFSQATIPNGSNPAYLGFEQVNDYGAELTHIKTDGAGVPLPWFNNQEKAFAREFYTYEQLLEEFTLHPPPGVALSDVKPTMIGVSVSENWCPSGCVGGTAAVGDNVADYLEMVGIFDDGYWPRRMKFNGGCYVEGGKIALIPLFGWLNPWFAALLSNKPNPIQSLMLRFITLYDIATDQFELVLNQDSTDNVIYYNPLQTRHGAGKDNGGVILMQAGLLTDATYTLRSGFATFNPYEKTVGGLGPLRLDRSAPYANFAAPSPEYGVAYGLQLPVSAVVLNDDGILIYAPYLSEAFELVWTTLEPSTLKAIQFTDNTVQGGIWADQIVNLLSIALYAGYIAITCNRPQAQNNGQTLAPMVPNQIVSFQSQDALFYDDGGVEAIQIFPLELQPYGAFLSAAPITVVGDYAVPSGVLMTDQRDSGDQILFPEYSMRNCVIKLTKYLKVNFIEKIYGGSKGRTQKILPRALASFVQDASSGRKWLSKQQISSSAVLSRPSDMVRCSRLANEDFRVPAATDKSIFPCENPFFVPMTIDETPEEAEETIVKNLKKGFVIEGNRYLAVTPGTFGPGTSRATVGGVELVKDWKLGSSSDWPNNDGKIILPGSDGKQSASPSGSSQIPIDPCGCTQPAASRIFSSTVVGSRTFLYATPTNTAGPKKLLMSEIRRGLPGQGNAFGVQY